MGVIDQVVGIEGGSLGNCVEAGALTRFPLQGIDPDHHRIRVDRGGDLIIHHQEDAGEVTAVDGGNGHVNHRLEGGLGAAGQKQVAGNLGQADV